MFFLYVPQKARLSKICFYILNYTSQASECQHQICIKCLFYVQNP
ncbi:MAG: hypothetical protein J6A05_03505 [Oscillospiraceae bacterium]|nr:hypothetical protein [Oscillospiraceae bacterium]